MSISILSSATALALVALGAGPPQQPPQPTVRIEVAGRVGEGQLYSSRLPDFESEPQAVVLVHPPVHGKYIVTESTRLVQYEPDEGYFGRDRLVFEVQAAGRWWSVEYQIDVVPRIFPLIGRWTGGSVYGPAYYDTQARQLVTCGNVTAQGAVDCQSHALASLVPTDGIPVVLPKASGTTERLGIFDLATGKMYELTLRSSSFSFARVLAYPDAIGHFPVVGNWGGEGESLAFIRRDGGIASYSALDAPKTAWPKVLGQPDPTQLTWPVRFPQAGYDAIALAEPATHFFPWQGMDAQTGVEWFSPRLDVRRPIHWPGGVPDLGVAGNYVLFVLLEDEDGQLSLGGYDFESGKPSTIPITFPNDPSG